MGGGRKNNTLRAVLLVIGFSSAVLFIGLGNTALWDRDETEYALAATEMQSRGDWLIPTLYGRPFLEKPILTYWLLRGSYAVLGVNEFSSRLPSALFGISSCVAVYFLGAALWGHPVGIYSALILSTSILFVGVFHMLLTDPPLVFFSILSFIFFIYSEKRAERSGLFLALSYVSIGFGFLSKGPIALFPMLVWLIYQTLTRRPFWPALLRSFGRQLLFLIFTLLVAAPWFGYALLAQKQAAAAFFLRDNLARMYHPFQGHSGPALYYLPVIFFGMFPWSFFVAAWIVGEWRQIREAKIKLESGVLLLVLWVLVIITVFSLSVTKLPHYALPAVPPLACLLGKAWQEGMFKSRGAQKYCLLGALFLCLSVVLAAAAFYLLRPQYASPRLMAPFVILAGFLLVAIVLEPKVRSRLLFAMICSGAALCFITCFTIMFPWVDRHRVIRPIALSIKRVVPENAEIYSYGNSEPSLFFYSGRYFPTIKRISLDMILGKPKPVYLVIQRSALEGAAVGVPYRIIEQKEGFAENGGEMTLLLITNDGT